MAKTRKLVVEVLADASRLGKTFGQISGQTETLGKQFQKFGRNVGLGLGAAAGAAGVFAVTSLKAAEEAEQVQKRVAQVIKATGGAANVTASQIDKYAAKQQYLVGVDDEVLKKSYGILLTFKNVRNEAGKGNRVFDRSTKALADLAAAGFGDTDSAAKALGKALQDPIRGVQMLSKAGVTFTDQQKAQIKTLVESGDLLSAQKLILAEVEGQVGGVAAAGTTASETLSLMFQDLQENIGAKLLPIFQSLTKFLRDKVIPAVRDLAEKYGPKLREAFDRIRERLEPLVRMLAEKLVGAFRKVAEFASENKEAVAAFIAVLAGAAVIAGIVALGAAIAGLFNPVTLVIVGIAALAAEIVYAYKNFERFREIVDMVGAYLRDAWPGIQGFLVDALNTYAETVGTVIDTVVEQWRRYGDDILKILAGAFDLIRGLVNTFRGLFTGDWTRMFNGLAQITQGATNVLFGIFGGLYEMLRYATSGIFGFIGGVIRSTLNGIASGFERLVNLVIDGTNRLIKGFNNLPFQPNLDLIPRLNIPRLAKGGIVTSPTIAMIGEAGPEAIIPLSRQNSMGGNITINVQASPLSSPADVGAAVVDALKAYERRNGTLPLKVA